MTLTTESTTGLDSESVQTHSTGTSESRVPDGPSAPLSSARVYKVLRAAEREQFEQSGVFLGNPSDVRDGYVHLSGASQLGRVLAKHFAGERDLRLVELTSSELLAQLRWEPNAKGELYPHHYAPLKKEWIAREWRLNDASKVPAELASLMAGKPENADPLPVLGTPQMSWRSAIASAVGTGLLYFLAFPGIDVWPLSFITWVPLLLALEGRTVKQGTILAWVSGFTMTFVGFYWLLEMLQTFSGFGAPICLLFMVLLACYQGGRIGLFGFFYRRAVTRGWWKGPSFVLAFAVSEFAYPLLFPWYFGATVHQIPQLTQVADLGNPIVVGLVLCGVNYALTEAILAWRKGRALPFRLGAAQLALLGATVAYGVFRIAQVDASVAAAPKGNVGIVQANMGLMEKRKDRDGGLRRHLDLTHELEAQGPIDLIVWPETSVAGAVYEAGAEASYRELFTSTLRSPTLIGAVLARPVSDARRYSLLNSALMLRPGGELVGSYSKHVLLAFGEYLPLGSLFPKLYEWSPNTGLFDPGDSSRPLTASGHAVSVHICYEDVLPSYVNSMLSEEPADLLVNMTNDAWYGDTTQPWIHLALASFRAIEHRKYFVRSTNSGVSAFMDPAGRVVQHSETFVPSALRHEVAYLNGPATPYETYGDLPWWLCSVLLAVACFLRRGAVRASRIMALVGLCASSASAAETPPAGASLAAPAVLSPQQINTATTAPLPAAAETAASQPLSAETEPATTAAEVKPAFSEAQLQVLAERIDSVLEDARADLGLTPGALRKTRVGAPVAIIETQLQAPGKDWSIQPILEQEDGRLVLRLWARGSDPRTLLLSVNIEESKLEVAAIQALRGITTPLKITSEAPPVAPPLTEPVPHSPGLPILASTGLLLGGYFGFALDQMGAHPLEKPALLYPIVALGAGIGFGASLVIAGEWDVSTPKAWYLSAATLWPTAAATLISSYGHRHPHGSDFSYGLIGSGLGLALGGLAVSSHEVSEAEALFVHSGGLFGGVLGGVVQRVVTPIDPNRPYLGFGIGMGAGVVLAGLISWQLEPLSWERVIYVDLGAALGALSGAALASPFVAGAKLDGRETRLWAGATGAGAIIGATIGALLTVDSNSTPSKLVSALHGWVPTVGSPALLGPASGISLGVRRAF